ncbi:MAG: S-layer homology domain-containing protein [Roseburia sp.]|nr:S-layer homology domain-containing protein [Roseburia sp.]MCM1096834.1 S-layer homology domain-containing protein [Ruminococcus flavefaciens]
MKRDQKKRNRRLLLVALILAVTLAGCGSAGNGDAEAAGGRGAGGITRAEYIGMLGTRFGYNGYESEEDLFTDVASDNTWYPQIQAAAEWQIIDGGGSFEPEEAATLEFALECAVRAVGTDDIAASGAEIELDSLADFYAGNIAQIDLSDRDAPVDAEVAEQIILYAKSYDNNLVIPQITEIEFVEGVKTGEEDIFLNADGVTGVMADGSDYQIGDIVYLDATETSIARAILITEVEGSTFTYEDAPLEDTYAYLNIQGSFSGQIVEAVSASSGTEVDLGQEIYDEMKSYYMSDTLAGGQEYWLLPASNSVKVDQGGDHVVFTACFDVTESEEIASRPGYANIGVDGAANGKLVVGIRNVRVDVKYESAAWYKPLSPKIVECSLHFDTEVFFTIHGSVGASIPLGEVYIQVWGPLNIKLMLTAHIGADGNIAISYTTENVMSIGWQKDSGLKNSFDSVPEAEFDADATLTAEATLLADLRIGFKKASYSLVNAQVTCGAVAAAKLDADPMGEQPTCLDLKLYIPLRWGVNQNGCLLTDISSKLKFSGVIWDSESSPLKLHMHLEDWVRTSGDECTRQEAVEQELTTPEGEPLEEMDPFDFEPIEFDFIELVTYTMFLEKGGSMSIGFDNIPAGYTEADLSYEVADPAVCSVANGVVTAGAAGSTIVKISTADGMFTVALAVTVNEDYSVEEFESL